VIPISVEAPTLYHGDCLAFIFADGPYYKVKGDTWERPWKTPAEFLAWMGELAFGRTKRAKRS
jgi:hypothetical protein